MAIPLSNGFRWRYRLGGDDFDIVIIDWMAAEFQAEGVD